MAQDAVKLQKLSGDSTIKIRLVVTKEYQFRYWLFRNLIYLAAWMAVKILGCNLEFESRIEES